MNGPAPQDRTTDHVPSPQPPNGAGGPADETAPTLPNRPPVPAVGSTGVTVSEGGLPPVPPSAGKDQSPPPPAIEREWVGRYRIQARVGAGGFGIVCKGRDEGLQRDVAIKIAHPHRVSTPEDVESFLKEGRILASLDHPGIVPVYDFGTTEDGLCYLVSKFIDGRDLASRVRQGRLSHVESAMLIASVADALHHAHQRGMVHRDIKPANIMLVAEDRPILVDFGLALRDQDFGRGPCCAGTPAYMSPEQAREEGHLVNLHTDIYSLGTVLYELLAGQRPFQADEPQAILELIKTREPTPLRHIDDTIPRELERICLKALSKRASDRHVTARELADDLRHWLAEQKVGWVEGREPAGSGVDRGTRSTQQPPIGHSMAIKVVPKGLRSFDADDADFFLKLLPGPCGRDGLPDSVRFWRQRLEETDSDKTFRLGVLYGPSGCGKSSLVKAGLLPRLAGHVLSVYVEATPDDTERRLLRGLRQRCPDLPDSVGLVESLAYLRRGRLLPAGKKIVVVLDQFEQWLHAHPINPSALLLQALRQCDGGRVQCVLLVRDDFWMSLIRFLRELEVPLREGENSAAVDRFDVSHARRVLAAFGRAYGALPEGEPSAEQKRFVEQAVSGLAQDREVVPVRLSLFAEMVKGKPWVPATLESVGGAKGIGVLFLEESFAAATAPPEQRLHQKAARAVLGALLPEAGSGIRGRLQPRRKLLDVSGYADRPRDFEELLHILDTRLRLITPTEPEQTAGAGTTDGEAVYYQLAHDYLVEPLRRWLTSKQRETLRGRAALRLADHAALWSARTERRHLPSLLGWLDALLWTSRDSWTASERRMMRAASRWHAFRAAILLCLLTALGFLGATGWKAFLDQREAVFAQSAVERLLHAETADLPRLLADFDRHRRVAEPLLRTVADDPARPPKERLHASLALLPNDPDRAEYLAKAVYAADPEEIPVLADALRPFRAQFAEGYWQVLQNFQAPADRRLRAACLLAAFDPDDARWTPLAATIAADFVAEKNPLHASQWMQALRPIRSRLVPPLTALFHNGATSKQTRSFITSILADYAADDTSLLAGLILEADQRSFVLLLESLKRNRSAAIQQLTAELKRPPRAEWDDKPLPDRTMPNRAIKESLESAHGMLTERFAFCQTLPLSDLDPLERELEQAGYRPNCFRPFDTPEGVRVAAIWVRDGRAWDWVHDTTARNLQEKDDACRRKGLVCVDLTHRAENGAARTYDALWVAPEENGTESALYVEVPESRHKEYWEPLNIKGFVPREVLAAFDPDGQKRHSSIRWKFRFAGPEYLDRWDATPAEYARLLTEGWYQTDVRVFLPAGNEEPRYAGVWWNGKPGRQSRDCHGLSPAEHQQQCRQMTAEGFRPLALSVAWNAAANRFETASVWHRPIPTEQSQEDRAQRQARAATALLQLGEASAVWPLFRFTPEPRLRGWLIHTLARTDTDPGLLLERLAVEPDVSARGALLLALAEYSGTAAQSEEDAPARAASRTNEIAARAAELYRDDPDPGVHSAAQFLLQRFGRTEQLAELDAALDREPADKERQWLRNSQGQTFAILRGPFDFRIGSPGAQPGHIHYTELQHRVRIPRSFAISTTEVTVEQFLRFRPAHPVDLKYTPEPSCPVTNVNWFDAVAYCRWLSEKEDIPEDQRCYPPIDQIKPGMKMPADFLRRTGYRLATEAEWEYACRAKTVTSRYFGQSNALLSFYALTPEVLRWKGSPVARLMPNDFGLFDSLGNAMEWCHDRYQGFGFLPIDRWRVDEFGPEEVNDKDERDWRSRRGGSFLHQPDDARAAQRDPGGPSSRHPFLGFRIVRTWK